MHTAAYYTLRMYIHIDIRAGLQTNQKIITTFRCKHERGTSHIHRCTRPGVSMARIPEYFSIFHLLKQFEWQ